MNKSSIVVLLLGLVFSGSAFSLSLGDNADLLVFGDISLGEQFGDRPDDDDGEGETPVVIHDGFGVNSLDMVLSYDISDRITFQAEAQLEVEGVSEVELDLERLLLDFQVSNLYNFQVGGFFTPIGYFNRALYSRSWLMYGIQRPELFEEELGGFVPTHTVGAQVYGNLPWGLQDGVNYAFSVGNGGGPDPLTRIYKQDEDDNVQLTWLFELPLRAEGIGAREFRLGLSGWTDHVKSLLLDEGDVGELDDDAEERFTIREHGFNPYLTLYRKHFNLLLEYVHIHHIDRSGNLGGEGDLDLTGYGAELSLNMMEGKMHPYVRYDKVEMPEEEGGPYFSLRGVEGSDDELTRVELADIERIMVGVAYDINFNLRVKAEYAHNNDGVRASDQFVVQMAFGF